MRVKTGVARRRRHNRLAKLAKGHRGRRKNCVNFMKNSVHKALTHAFHGRKRKKRDYRSLWISRINAGARLSDLSYSRFMHGLKQAGLELDRKMLADLAMNSPQDFASLCEKAKAGQTKAAA
ncbi:MAG: 50S ribosomal protein L20 [Bdellovibrionota bacterium]